MQWIYGLFLDLMSYCANALLGVMSTDLAFFEDSVPIVPTLYGVFTAIGWGLLIGNCAFQCMKAMFAGFGFETESPAILLLRTFLFGFLLIFSKDICEIGLSIGKNVIDLLGIPTSVALSMPTDAMFTGVGASWLLVIIIGFVLGFQLIKLFFEIAERYAIVAVLTMLCPVGLAFGGSKSTKDICTGFIRTYASMIVMMVMNVLFLKLILSALAAMPTDIMVLPWCLLVVGIAKTARKADQLISKIGLNPAVTGDPLGAGRGLMVAAMAARTIMAVSGKAGGAKLGSGKGGSIGKSGSTVNTSSKKFGGNTGSNVRNSTGGTNVNGSNTAAGVTFAAAADTNTSTQRNTSSSNMGGSRNVANNQSASNVRFGANTYNGGSHAGSSYSGRPRFGSSGKAQVNTNRFGSQPGMGKPGDSANPVGNTGKHKGADPAGASSRNTVKTQNAQTGQRGKNAAGTRANVAAAQKAAKGTPKQTQRNAAQTAANNARKSRFGAGTVRQNANPVGTGAKTGMPMGAVRTNPGSTQSSLRPDAVEQTDTAKEIVRNASQAVTAPKDGEDDG